MSNKIQKMILCIYALFIRRHESRPDLGLSVLYQLNFFFPECYSLIKKEKINILCVLNTVAEEIIVKPRKLRPLNRDYKSHFKLIRARGSFKTMLRVWYSASQNTNPPQNDKVLSNNKTSLYYVWPGTLVLELCQTVISSMCNEMQF